MYLYLFCLFMETQIVERSQSCALFIHPQLCRQSIKRLWVTSILTPRLLVDYKDVCLLFHLKLDNWVSPKIVSLKLPHLKELTLCSACLCQPQSQTKKKERERKKSFSVLKLGSWKADSWNSSLAISAKQESVTSRVPRTEREGEGGKARKGTSGCHCVQFEKCYFKPGSHEHIMQHIIHSLCFLNNIIFHHWMLSICCMVQCNKSNTHRHFAHT